MPRFTPRVARAVPALPALGLVLLFLSTTARAQLKGAELLSGSRPSRAAMSTPSPATHPSPAPIQIKVGTFLGWERSLRISNGEVEALVIPAIGRVMHFGFAGEASPFWDDPTLRGRAADSSSAEWINFGGDKSWPAPQAGWPKVTPRSWPPPVAFDSLPVEATVRRDTLVLTSAVDPHYGIRCERVLRLEPGQPRMTIQTTYEKVEGPDLEVGIWIITQLTDPVLVAIPIPANTRFPTGYNSQSEDLLPLGLSLDRGMLSLRRDPVHATKIGTDADRLLWVGERQMLLIESPRVPGGRYPDQESSAEVYTNPDPKTYVELEMLGPLRALSVGSRISQTNTYTLLRRATPDPVADARRVLQLPR
ncbi:MAG: DUF4380 domain-containing protein [Verrucomicrobiales bacterium]|nr:DUF4380 domain-containing protein [Verrucomicrobiales bacterium]